MVICSGLDRLSRKDHRNVVLARVVPVGGGGGVVWTPTPTPTPTLSFKGVGGAARETERFPGLFMCGVPIGQRVSG